MIYVSVQPANDYFLWQLEVFDYAMKLNGYNINDSIIVFIRSQAISDNVWKYIDNNQHRVILVDDNREDQSYIPSIKLHGLYKLYKDHYDRIDGHNVFLHDSDIVFTKYFDWDSIVTNKKVYCSDTVGYIGANYIDSKSPILTDKMCDIVGISPQFVRDHNSNSGGAQLIFPSNSVNHDMFHKAEKDSIILYKYASGEGSKYKKENDPYPIQAWTSEMWSILWNIWQIGLDTEVHRDMEFAWPNWNIKDWDRVNIYHNSGVSNDTSGLFYKGKYVNKHPFGSNLSYVTKENTCNWKYTDLVKDLSHLNSYYP